MRPRLLVDCDGVLACFNEWCVELINHMFGTDHLASDITTWDFRNLNLTVEQNTAFRTCLRGRVAPLLEVYPHAARLLNELERLGDVIIVTSMMPGNPTWAHDRVEWLQRNLGVDRHRVVFAADKSAVDGVVLIDDYAKNLHQWEDGEVRNPMVASYGSTRRAILWRQPYSEDGGVTPWAGLGVAAGDVETCMIRVREVIEGWR